MTRIIAGAAGSLLLDVPASGTRPTSDRVRESVFSTLESMGAIDGSIVLDLYAGSGALGLEAMSRGAARLDLVESAPRAVGVIEGNIRRLERAIDAGAMRAYRTTADAFLVGPVGPYDLVFIDPPYELAESDLARTLEGAAAVASADAVIVVERAARSPQPTLPSALALHRHRRYGDTAIWWAIVQTPDAAQPRPASQSR